MARPYLLSISARWLLAPLAPEVLGYDFGTLSACAVLGAFLPDSDASEPKLKHLKLPGTQLKPFLLPTQIVHRRDQHRSLLHSLWSWAWPVPTRCRSCSGLVFWIGWAPVVALMWGYAG